MADERGEEAAAVAGISDKADGPSPAQPNPTQTQPTSNYPVSNLGPTGDIGA